MATLSSVQFGLQIQKGDPLTKLKINLGEIKFSSHVSNSRTVGDKSDCGVLYWNDTLV